MKLENLFESLGLSNVESKIYLCLLKKHRCSISDICEETGLYRPTIYRNIPKLLQTGIISKIKIGKRDNFVAENPEKLELLSKNIQNSLSENMPELNRLFESRGKRPYISYHEGKKAIMDIFENIIQKSKKGDVFYRYESPKGPRIVSGYYPPLYVKRATGPSGEIEKYVITNEETAKRRHPRIWRHTKYIPTEFDSFDYNISEVIYKDTVAFIDYDTESALVIKNQRFADFQLKIFKMLFRLLKDRGN